VNPLKLHLIRSNNLSNISKISVMLLEFLPVTVFVTNCISLNMPQNYTLMQWYQSTDLQLC